MDGVIVDLPCPVPATPDELLQFYRGELAQDRDKVWQGIDADWWAYLPWTNNGKEILALCEKWVGKENVVLCSYPCNAESAAGKILWIEHNMPDYAFRYILTPQKYQIASPRMLLLDDNDKNVRLFRSEGGAALLCPRPWNTNANLADDCAKFIDVMLENMTA